MAISATTGLHAVDVAGLELVNCRITPRQGPVAALNNCRDVLLERLNGPEQAGVFPQLDGSKTKNIRLVESGVIDAKRIRFGAGVDKSQLQEQ